MDKKILVLLMPLIGIPGVVYAMHIAEGFLPPTWVAIYFVLIIPFIYMGIKDIKNKTTKHPDLKMLLGLVAAYCFVLSALKLPSITGSSSHPTGTAFGAIVFGPLVMSVIGTLVLIFQAVFLAHGGITTLGANVFSMAIVGPLVAYAVYKLLKYKNHKMAVFIAAVLGNLTTYMITSVQLALAFPAKEGGVLIAFIKFISVFAITQIPLAIIEGLLTVVIFNFVEKYATSEIKMLRGDV